MSNESKLTLGVAVSALVLVFYSLFRSAPLPPQVIVQVPEQPPAQVSVQPVVVQQPAAEQGLLGGRVHNTQESFDAGIAVNGTEAISALRGASVTTVVATGKSVLARTELGGTVTALTAVATSTLTAAQVCDSSALSVTPVSTTPSITLPPTSTLFAACLTSNGAFTDLHYSAITTSSILVAGTGGTLINSSANTVAAGKEALLRVLRISDIAYKVYVLNLLN